MKLSIVTLVTVCSTALSTRDNTTAGNSTKSSAGADGGHMCNIAKAQVRVRAFMCVCVCRTKIREKVSVR